MSNRFSCWLCAVLALLVAVAALPASAQPAGRDTHVVQAGETLYRIARSNSMTVERLQRLNGLEGTDIRVGQTLRLTDRVPMPDRTTAPTPTPTPTPGGETGVRVPDRPTVDATPVPIPTDQTPRPDTAAPAATGRVHVVEPGETLFRIALRYNTDVDALRRLNGIQGDRIEIGQRLVVSGEGAAPVAGGSPAASPGGRPLLRLTQPREWSLTNTTVPADLVHFVEPGETLYSIASSLRIPVRELAAENSLSTAPLQPGVVLYLPYAVDPALADARPLPPPAAVGLALVYPDVMRGRPTASGEAYDPLTFTASHRDYPLGTVLLVSNPASGRSTFVRVIDRGPVSQSYLLELSAAAATALELDPNAARQVELRELP